ncbi:galectin-7-like [Kogia breviceps]|uniref:galectin-7-like n=1 Tax=Kogia breviceps TaxID=27615 RepID=UPI00279549AD|nr:galectin-7-like [Kogia breviceps]
MALSYSVPFETSVPEGFEIGTVLKIRGVVPSQANRFYINLLSCDKPDSDIVLHFNPRLDQSIVVMNTKECGTWGSEERVFPNVFQRGHSFELLLIAMNERFKIVVGDSESYEFIYRLPPKRSCLLKVDGDVSLDLLKIF